MLTNYDIQKICEKLDLPLVGVFMKDDLPEKRKIGSYIINMDNSDGEGTHWVFAKIFCDDDSESDNEFILDNKNYKYCGALYFDAFGIGMPQEIEKFLQPFTKKSINKRQIQNINSSQCGWYCIYCDYFLEFESNEPTFTLRFKDFINIWDKDPKKNLQLLKDKFKPL